MRASAHLIYHATSGLAIGMMMSLFGASLCTMDVEKKAQELIKGALNSDQEAASFTNYVSSHLLDIDTVKYDTNSTLCRLSCH